MSTTTTQPQTLSEMSNLYVSAIIFILFNLENTDSNGVLKALLDDDSLSDFLIGFHNPAELQKFINNFYPSKVGAHCLQNKLRKCRETMFIALNNKDFIQTHSRLITEHCNQGDEGLDTEQYLEGDDTYTKYEKLVNILNFTMPEYKPELLMF